MSRSLPPPTERRSKAPDTPPELAALLARVIANPASGDDWEELDEVCRALDRPDEAAALYSELLGSAQLPVEVRLDIGRRAADFCEEWFEEPAGTIEMLSRVLEIDQKQTWAFERLSVLLTAGSKWQALLAAYDAQLKATEADAAKARLLAEAARVARDFSGDQQRGSDYMLALALLRPTDDTLAATLERRLDEQARHTDLIVLWRARQPHLDAAARLKTELGIAERYLVHLRDGTSTLASLVAFAAQGGASLDMLPLLRATGAASDLPVPVRKQALETVLGVLLGANREVETVGVYEDLLALASDAKERAGRHQALCDVLSRAGRPDEALIHAALRLKTTPDDESAEPVVRRLAEEVSRLGDYVLALTDAAEAAEAAPRRIALWEQACRIEVGELSNREAAVALCAKILGEPKVDPASALKAIRVQVELLRELGREPELLEALVRRAALEDAQPFRRASLLEAGHLADRLAAPDRALSLFGQCLSADPKDADGADLEALSARIEILGRLGRHQGLVDALQDRAKIVKGSAMERADMVAAAQVFFEHLGDMAQAIVLWNRVESGFGRTEETLDALVVASERARRYEDVALLLADGAESTKDAGRKVRLLAHLGDIFRMHLRKEPEAIASYGAALDLDPSDSRSRQGLDALSVAGSFRHEAVECLARALSRAQETELLLSLRERRLECSPGTEERCAILWECADLEEAREDLPAAIASLAHAFSLKPVLRLQARLLDLGARTSVYAPVVQAFVGGLGVAEPTRARDLHILIGELCRTELMQLAAAADHFCAALKIDATSELALKSLISVAVAGDRTREGVWGLYTFAAAQGAWDVAVAEEFALTVSSPEAWEAATSALADLIARSEGMATRLRHDMRLCLALWHRDQLQDPDGAELVLKRATDELPVVSSLEILANLQRRAPGRPLVRTLLLWADQVGEEPAILAEAARVAEAEKDPTYSNGPVQRALAAARAAIAASEAAPELLLAQPVTELALWATDVLVRDQSGEGTAVTLARMKVLLDTAALPLGVPTTNALTLRAAHLAAGLKDDGEAVTLCERILERNPADDEARALLVGLHETAERYGEVVRWIQQELELPRALERRLALRLEQSRVFRLLGGGDETAEAGLLENLAELPAHPASLADAVRRFLTRKAADRAVRLLEEQARLILQEDSDRAADLFEWAGQIAGDELGDLEGLRINFQASVQACPKIPVLDRLADLHRDRSELRAEVECLELRLARTLPAADGAAAERRTTVVRLGDCLIRLGERDKARALLEAELAEDAAANDIRDLLAAFYEEAEEWEPLAEVLASGVPFAQDTERLVQMLKRAALVWTTHLADYEAAIPLLEQARSQVPEDREIRFLLSDTLRRAEHYEWAKALLEGLLEEYGRRRTKERADVHLQLARVAQATGDLDYALEHAEQAAKIERTDPDVLMLVGRLAREKGQLDRAEQAYQTLLLIVGRKAESEADGAAGAGLILFELHRIAEEEGDHVRARELLASAIESAVADAEEAVRLDAAVRAAGRGDLVLEALDGRLKGGVDGSPAAQVHVTKARILARAERHEEALGERLLALRYTPDNARLVDAAQKLAIQVGDPGRFIRALEEIVPRTAPSVQADLWYRAAQIAEPLDGDAAFAFYEKSLGTGHRVRRGLSALERLATPPRADRMRRAMEIYVASAEAAEDSSFLAETLYRLAALALGDGRMAAAFDLLTQAQAAQPRPHVVLALLEPLLETAQLSGPLLKLLALAARENGAPGALLGALVRLSKEPEPELAQVLEATILARDRGDGASLRELCTIAVRELLAHGASEMAIPLIVERAGLAEADGEFGLAASLLGQAIELSPAEARVELLVRSAEVHRGHLGALPEAIALYEQAFAYLPGEKRIWQPLLELYRKTGNLERLVQALGRVEEDALSSEDRAALEAERVNGMVALGQVDEAEARAREFLERDPDSLAMSRILSGIFEKTERRAELHEFLEQQLKRARGLGRADFVKEYGMRLAASLVATDRAEALSVLMSGLSLLSRDYEVLRYLAGLFTDEDSQSDRAEVLEYLIPLEQGSGARAACTQLIAIREASQDDYGLLRALELAFKAMPADAELAARLIDQLRAQGEWSRLSETLQHCAERTKDVELAARYFFEAAEIFQDSLGETMPAAQAYVSAFELKPGEVSILGKAVDLLASVGLFEEALGHLSRAIEAADDLTLADLLERRVRLILSDRADDATYLQIAAGDLRRALTLFLTEEQAHELSESLLEVLGRVAAASAASGEVEAEETASVELCSLLVARGRRADACARLEELVTREPSALRAARMLAELASADGNFDLAELGYRALIGKLEGAERKRLALEVATFARASGEPLRVRDLLEAELAAAPRDREIMAALVETFQAAEAGLELAEMFMSRAQLAESPAEASLDYLRAADIWASLNQFENAIRATEAALPGAAEPGRTTARLALYYAEAGEVDRARELLDEMLVQLGKRKSPDLAIVQHAMAGICRAAGDTEGMLTWLEAALMTDRNHGESAVELAKRAQELGRYELAVKALQMVTLAKGDWPMSKAEAFFRQAQIFEAQGDPKKALVMARRAVTTEAHYVEAERMVQRLG